VRFPAGSLPKLGLVEFQLPGALPIKMSMVRLPAPSGDHEILASLQTLDGDWAAIKVMSLWLFHTPAGALPSLPQGVPAIASWR
jgi:cellulose synthase (UDP-forming)